MAHTTDVPLLTTPLEVADYLTDTTNTWADRCNAHDKARHRLGLREGDRLWNLAGQIVEIRANRPGCAVGWCPACARTYTLIDTNLSLPAHLYPGRYDRICPASGHPGLNHTPTPADRAVWDGQI